VNQLAARGIVVIGSEFLSKSEANGTEGEVKQGMPAQPGHNRYGNSQWHLIGPEFPEDQAGSRKREQATVDDSSEKRPPIEFTGVAK
tara:strand:- start:12000 stop:12260 length:261 start_codon:yes stop_codon:yes gene_type:complete